MIRVGSIKRMKLIVEPLDIALNTLQPHPDYVGIICTRANVHDICHEAIGKFPQYIRYPFSSS